MNCGRRPARDRATGAPPSSGMVLVLARAVVLGGALRLRAAVCLLRRGGALRRLRQESPHVVASIRRQRRYGCKREQTGQDHSLQHEYFSSGADWNAQRQPDSARAVFVSEPHQRSKSDMGSIARVGASPVPPRRDRKSSHIRRSKVPDARRVVNSVPTPWSGPLRFSDVRHDRDGGRRHGRQPIPLAESYKPKVPPRLRSKPSRRAEALALTT